MRYKNEKFLRLIPLSGERVNWRGFSDTLMKPIFDDMARTEQNPDYHGEVDVLTHTRMVCEALVRDPEYQKGTDREKTVLFLAALFHDIGKIKCTRLEDGSWRSPHHARSGSMKAREILWRDLGFCGTAEKQQLREAVCRLVRYHSFPPYAMNDSDPERKLLRIAADGALTRDFSLNALLTLERADILGRICRDTEESLKKIDDCRRLAEEAGCLHGPFAFANEFSRRVYFREKTARKDQALFNDTWGEIVMLAGLPGTGKDTWIAKNVPDLPMISLDDIRRRLQIRPTENQSRVIAEAYDIAKEYMRKKQPFVWNATNITPKTRGWQISLFEEYGASVRTVFLETEWHEQLRRNAARRETVPVFAIERMLSKLEPPECAECEHVTWEIV